MARSVLCADIGSSSLKAALINDAGRLLAYARVPYQKLSQVDILSTVYSVHWEAAFRTAAAALLRRGQRPEAVCISGNGPTLVPVLADGSSLPPLHWYGPRKRLPAGSLFLPYAACFRENQPDLYGRVRRFLSCQEWLCWRLGAAPVTCLPSEAYAPYYWDGEQCRLSGLDPEKFPPFVELGSVTGEVSPAASAEFGIEAGTPIVAGGPDFVMALVGAGALEPGLVCNRAGSSEGINVCIRESGVGSFRNTVSAEPEGLRVLPHVAPGCLNIAALQPLSGRLFEWYREITGQQKASYDRIMAKIMQAEPGKAAFYPDGRLEFPHGLPDAAALGRGVLESIACMARQGLDRLAQEGFPVSEMRLSGGQSRNAPWNQMKADITGVVLHTLAIPDGELAGDAALAWKALGLAGSLREAAGRIVRIARTYEPDREKVKFYREIYEKRR